MGKSAKFLKRTHKKAKSSATASNGQSSGTPTTTNAQLQTQTAKKKANLKSKVTKTPRADTKADGGVLGGADYVNLLMGGRRRAKEEAAKLPKGDDDGMDVL